MATKAEKIARLEARIPARQKTMLQRAAALQGQSLTEFILSATTAKAKEVIRDYEFIDLNLADQLAFAESLLHPPKPNKKLRQAASRHKAKTDP